MATNEKKSKVVQTQAAELKVGFSAVLMGGSLLLDMAVISMYRDYLWLIILLSLIFVACTYVFTASLLELKRRSDEAREDMMNDILKSSKASYLLMRKYFDEIEEQLDEMEDKMGVPEEELINAQKSIAKVTISRNKENADALMNSNDKLLEKIFDFEEDLKNMEEKIIVNQRAAASEGMHDLVMKQTELENQIKQMQLVLEKTILETMAKAPQPLVMQAPMMQAMPAMQQAAPTEGYHEIHETELNNLVEAASAKLDLEAGDMANEEPMGEILSFDEAFGNEEVSEESPEEEVSLAEAAESEDPLPEIDLFDAELGLESTPGEEELGDLLEGLLEGLPEAEEEIPEPAIEETLEEIPTEEAPAEEAAEAPAPVEEVVSEPEPEVEAVAEPEPVVEEAAPAFTPSDDPNHKMTPEEIAALIAGTTDTPAEEPVIEPEPVVEAEPEPEPAAEEKPAMPDLSDPNHVMTPEEIQALLANM